MAGEAAGLGNAGLGTKYANPLVCRVVRRAPWPTEARDENASDSPARQSELCPLPSSLNGRSNMPKFALAASMANT